ncbi:MAG: carboxymuconolactone decarboxylase family protein [Maioricimonas sp. JB045]
MPRVQPLPESEAQDKVAQTYGRIRELLGVESLPEMFLVYGRVEPFLRDFYMNFKTFVYTDGALTRQQKSAIALAVSCHAKSEPWMEFCTGYCRDAGWNEQQIAEIIAVASTNYMYNTFFKFRDLSGSALFEGMPVGLRAHTFTSTSLGTDMVELINIAISDINACKPCTSGHVDAARGAGLNDNQLLETIQCAATIYAGAQFLSAAGAE